MATAKTSSKPRRIVVLGGALSGPAAAARARETSESAKITLLERNTRVSYAVGGLAYLLSGEVRDVKSLDQQGPDFFRRQFGIRARTGVRVTRIDPDKKVLIAGRERIPYDSLVYALGVESVVPPIKGFANASNVHVFRNLTDLEHIVAGLEDVAKRGVTIIGGGYFGLEAADGLLRLGVEVTVVEKEKSLLPGFSAQSRYFAMRALMNAGASVILGAEVTRGFLGKRRAVRSLQLRDRVRLETDLVLVAAGVRPRSRLLAAAGADIGSEGAVIIDGECRTTLEDVFACGVCVRPRFGAMLGGNQWSPQAAQADITAQVAGANAAGGKERLTFFSGSSILRLGEWAFARVGVNSQSSILVQAPSRDPFFPESRLLQVRLFHSGGDRPVLMGAEVAGRDPSGVKQRIDLLTAALAGSLRLEDLAGLDFAYEAPFSTARDAVNVAAAVGLAVEKFGIRNGAPDRYARDPGRWAFVDVRADDRRSDPKLTQRLRRLPFEELRRHLDLLPRNKPLVFLSETGREGFLAARLTQHHGFSHVEFLEGGVTAYEPSALDFLRD